MLQEFTANLATQMGIRLSRVKLIDGKLLGCRDSHLVQMYSDGTMESALVYQREIDELQQGLIPLKLESRLRAALSRLHLLTSSSSNDLSHITQ